MIGVMNLETEDTLNLKNVVKASIATAFTFICMVVGFIVIFRLTFVDETASTITPTEEVTVSCEEAGGVIVRGVHQHGDAYNRFTVCIPYEALTCIDVE